MRQPLMFVLVGGLQYLLDAALFGVFLSAGLSIPTANVLSRASAATGGFLANRYLTFSKRADTVASFTGSLLRFITLWLTMTFISTGLMLAVSHLWGAELGIQMIGKLLVEAILAIISFVISKYWVYRN
jgi:putative flippase GtrA